MLDLAGWPTGMRVIVRREPIHPKYERELKPYEKKTDFRYQAIATNTPGGHCSSSTPGHRSHTHVEAGIRRGKALSLNLLPSKSSPSTRPGAPCSPWPSTSPAGSNSSPPTGKLARAEPATLRTHSSTSPRNSPTTPEDAS